MRQSYTAHNSFSRSVRLFIISALNCCSLLLGSLLRNTPSWPMLGIDFKTRDCLKKRLGLVQGSCSQEPQARPGSRLYVHESTTIVARRILDRIAGIAPCSGDVLYFARDVIELCRRVGDQSGSNSPGDMKLKGDVGLPVRS